MAIADVPNIPPQYAPVMIAQASQAQKSTANIDRTLGVCLMVSNPSTLSDRSGNTLSPVLIASSYFNSFEHKLLEGTSKVTVLQNPMHGTLEDLGTLAVDQYGKVTRDTGERKYFYQGEAGYVGQDSVTLLVEKAGYKVKVIYFFHVFDEIIYDDVPYTEELCPNGENLWKISTLPAPGTVVKDGTIQSWLAATDFSSLLAAPSGVSFNIAGLTGGALGQTTGKSITLDTNAAGNNWFIDTTPADNSEFLPTSNPNEWVAKVGTAAYGKMDMLSVLLHEYGHALGIEHSADSRDYMATTLTAGVRRLPSADELALMQQLVSGVQADMANSPSLTLPQWEREPSQLPLLPLGGFGLAFLGRLRSSCYGSINIEADLNTLLVNYEAFAKLTNGREGNNRGG